MSFFLSACEEQKVASPENVEGTNAAKDESLISLQTCTLPDFSQRLVIQVELEQKSA